MRQTQPNSVLTPSCPHGPPSRMDPPPYERQLVPEPSLIRDERASYWTTREKKIDPEDSTSRGYILFAALHGRQKNGCKKMNAQKMTKKKKTR